MNQILPPMAIMSVFRASFHQNINILYSLTKKVAPPLSIHIFSRYKLSNNY